MRSRWQKHLVICLVLGLLIIPIYYLDRALVSGGGGSDWITLDFRGLILWTCITLLAIDVGVSSIAVFLFPKPSILRIHLSSVVISIILLATGLFGYGKLSRFQTARSYRAFMENRRQLLNVIQLKEWWYFPNDTDPTEVRMSVVVHDSGRFAGNVTGEETDQAGGSRAVFESRSEPERQRQVHSGDAFIYVLPLEILHSARADNVRITLYLFKALSGPSTGDIAKVFTKAPERDDDGEYFYGQLPPPSQSRD